MILTDLARIDNKQIEFVELSLTEARDLYELIGKPILLIVMRIGVVHVQSWLILRLKTINSLIRAIRTSLISKLIWKKVKIEWN